MMRDDDKNENNGDFQDQLDNRSDTASLQQFENNKGRHLKLLSQLRWKKKISGEEFAHVVRAYSKYRDDIQKQRRLQ